MTGRIVGYTIGAMWVTWLLIWYAAAAKVKETSWHESVGSQMRHRIPLFIAVYLVVATHPPPGFMTRRFIPLATPILIAGAALVAAGLGIALWARWYLGTNWSAAVTVKKDHALIRSGPYRMVRHPIYSGILLAFVGDAIAIGEWRGLVALGLVLLAFLLKSREEEARMSGVFPEYAAYRRETAALIPYVL